MSHCAQRLLFVAVLVAFVLCAGCAQSTVAPTAAAAPSAVTAISPVAAPATIAPAAAVAAASTFAVVTPVSGKTKVRVFCAGSLMIPFAALETAFEAANPDLDMEMEAHGSIQVIRHVTDLHEPIDVVASADHALLQQLMYGTTNPDTGKPYADWTLRFASNRVVIAYGPHSAGAGEITEQNWADVLSRPGTRVGLSDPRFDALGYRELMILQLAESYYGKRTLFEDMTMGRFAQPIRAVQESTGVVIHVPEVLEPREGSTIVMRGASIQLIPLLQAGAVDYIFEYESVARQHKLTYTPLPDALNLGDINHAAGYSFVSTKLDFRRFAAVEPTFRGEVIAYGLTIPTSAAQPAAAERLVTFLLGPEGQAVMAANDQPMITPARADRFSALPAALQPLCAAE